MVNYEEIPMFMKNEVVAKYHKMLMRKKYILFFKRVFDLVFSLIMAIILFPVLIMTCIIIKCDSPGKVIFKQKRITQCGRVFDIFKFRTMVEDAEKIGTQVTTGDDPRITKCGKWLRKYRIDELPQIFNIIRGELSFVGPRPEVQKYVLQYTDEMLATLLIPAGVTSLASIVYKDESKMLENANNPDEVYVKEVLPQKMKYNIEYIEKMSIAYDIKIILKTICAVLKK